MDGAAQFGIAADQWVDLAVAGLLVEVDAEVGQSRALLGFCPALVIAFTVFGTAHFAFLAGTRLGDPVTDEVDCVQPAHVLLFKEIGCMAFPFREYSNEHIGTRHLFATR